MIMVEHMTWLQIQMGIYSIQYSLTWIKVCDGADKKRVGRRRLVGVYLCWLGPTVPVPAGEGAALADAADDEEEEEDEGGDGGDQDVEPALRSQLGPTAREAGEEEHVVIPVSAAQVIPAMTMPVYYRARDADLRIALI